MIGDRAGLLAKIEKPSAVTHIEDIIRLSDAIMVARGDLGVETPHEDAPGRRKEIARACRAAVKPVIVATRMLESMVSAPAPTRAEASDVATAIYDGADADRPVAWRAPRSGDGGQRIRSCGFRTRGARNRRVRPLRAFPTRNRHGGIDKWNSTRMRSRAHLSGADMAGFRPNGLAPRVVARGDNMSKMRQHAIKTIEKFKNNSDKELERHAELEEKSKRLLTDFEEQPVLRDYFDRLGQKKQQLKDDVAWAALALGQIREEFEGAATSPKIKAKKEKATSKKLKSKRSRAAPSQST